MKSLVYLLALLPIVLGNLSSRYAFSTTLYDRNGDTYVLHWNFSTVERTITFAVNVSTMGWVGFGISSNGGMVNSDVVIGWVQSGRAYFHVSWCEMTSVACCTLAYLFYYLVQFKIIHSSCQVTFWDVLVWGEPKRVPH